MRALFQKLRASTSSKGNGNGYTPTSKELEKEKNFRPLPEWPPTTVNNQQTATKESAAPVVTTPAVLPELSVNSSVRYPSQVTSRPSQAISLDSELPPLPSFGESIDAKLDLDPKSRKRASISNTASTFTEAPKKAPKDPQQRTVATPPPGANPSSSNPISKANGKTSPLGHNGTERRKPSQENAAPANTATTKPLASGRGSTSTNQTVNTFRAIPASTGRNTSSRALVTSPQPGASLAAHAQAVPAHLRHDHPHQPHGKYNTMGLPMADNVSIIRAASPMSQMSERTGVLTTASWSEAAEEDLVSNIGQRERTRQEVLWEIVASEQRYVYELMKMKESFIDPLLHPFAVNPLAAQSDDDYYREETPAQSVEHLPIASRFLGPSSLRSVTPGTPNTLATHRTNATTPMIPTPDPDSDSERDDYDEAGPNAGKLVGGSKAGKKTSFALSAAAKASHPRSPYGTTSRASGAGAVPNMNPRLARMMPQLSSRSHHSLPPQPRSNAPTGAVSTTSLGRKSAGEDKEQPHRPATTDPTSHDRRGNLHAHFAPSPPPGRVLKKARRGSEDKPKMVVFPGGVPPHVLPEDFRKCLEVIESGILIGHLRLSDALRKRYDEQYPLVRSLADVFVGNSEILHEYATYVLHLERALEQVDLALNGPTVVNPKQPDSSDKVKITKLLQYLERRASSQGETGVAISLSKPFQRLLKYPLLFQNLLFHTDPSTFEYESTLQMVAEVETIVRSIEDEKIQKEERDKTRDAIARIDGMDKDKGLALFKPARLIIDERPQEGSFADPNVKSSPPVTGANKDRAVKQKSSFRRFSEALGPREEKNGLGSKRDLWLVVFNDVVLLCQRTGTTTLPLSTTTNARSNSLPDKQGTTKYATSGKRVSSQVRPRNLYRFLKIESWTINEKPKPRELVSKEAIERWRTQQASGHLMGSGDEPEEEIGGIESDDSDRKSKMSFSYWGADKVTLTKPMSKRGVPTNASRTAIRTKPQAPSAFAGRQSDKDAKFGTRLRSPEPSQDGSVVGSARPGSRRMGGPPASPTTTRRNIDSRITNGSMTSVVSSKPGWDTSTRANITSAAGTVGAAGGQQPAKRVRNTSVTSGPPRVGNAKTLSAVPSEDSGVGMYRQIIAHDPSISSAKS